MCLLSPLALITTLASKDSGLEETFLFFGNDELGLLLESFGELLISCSSRMDGSEKEVGRFYGDQTETPSHLLYESEAVEGRKKTFS